MHREREAVCKGDYRNRGTESRKQNKTIMSIDGQQVTSIHSLAVKFQGILGRPADLVEVHTQVPLVALCQSSHPQSTMVLTKDCLNILFVAWAELVANRPFAEDSVASLVAAVASSWPAAAVAASSWIAVVVASSSLAAAAASTLPVAVAVAVVVAAAYPSAVCSPRSLAARPTALKAGASACSVPRVRVRLQ